MSGPARLVYRLDMVLLVGLLIVAALVVIPLLIGNSTDGVLVAFRSSATPSLTPTATPSVTPTPTQTHTATASPTVTTSPSATASHTATPTATVTPSSTPTPSPTSSPTHTPSQPPPTATTIPLATPRVEPLAMYELFAGVSFTVSGQGIPGNTIVLYDNDRRLATAIVDDSGFWRIIVTGLSVGEHRLVVVAISPDDRMSDDAPVGFVVILRPTEARPSPEPAVTATVTLPSDTPAVVGLLPSATSLLATFTETPGAADLATAVPPSDTPAAVVLLPSATPIPATAIPSATPTPSPLPPALTPTVVPSATPTPTTTPLPPVIGGPAAGSSVPAGRVSFNGRGTPGSTVIVVDQNGAVRGSTTVGSDGRWMLDADLSNLQGAATMTALVQDPAGQVLGQSSALPLTVVAQFAPPTGAEQPPGSDSVAVRAGVALTVILGLALLIGGLVLRQAGVIVRLRERDEP